MVAVISGSGMAAFVSFQLRSEQGWHHEKNRPWSGRSQIGDVFLLKTLREDAFMKKE